MSNFFDGGLIIMLLILVPMIAIACWSYWILYASENNFYQDQEEENPSEEELPTYKEYMKMVAKEKEGTIDAGGDAEHRR